MSALVAVQTSPRRLPWLRLAIVTVAAVQLGMTLRAVPNAFVDYHPHASSLSLFAHKIVAAEVLAAPLIAVTAFALAVFGRLNHAVLALAGLVIAAWIATMPSLESGGLDLWAHGGDLDSLWISLVAPISASVASVFAVRDRNLPWAALLASAPLFVTYTTNGIIVAGMSIAGS